MNEPDRLAVSLRLVLGVTLLYAAVLRPVVISPDERSMLAVSLAVLEGRGFSVPPQMGSAGPDGRFYSNWYPLNSAIALPFVAIGRVAARVAHLPAIYVAAPFAAVTTILATALGVLAVWMLGLALGGTERDALIAALAYAFGTVLLFYGRTFFADPLLASIVTVGVLAAVRSDRTATWLALATSALAVVAKPTGVVLGGVIAVWHLLQGHWRRAAVAGLGTAAGLAVYGWYNYVRFGSPSTFGQKWGGFTTCCVPEAVTGLLVSPGRGLLVYSPVLLVSLAALALEWRRPSARLLGLVLAGFTGIHAVWGEWQGGWSWGSRLMVPVVGVSCAALVWTPPRLRRVVPVLVAIGFLVNAPTLAWSFHEYNAEAAERGLSSEQMTWNLRESQLARAWPSALALIARTRGHDVRTVVARAGVDDASSTSEVYQVVPLWWWLAPAAGVPWPAAALVALLLGGAGGLLLRSAWRSTAMPAASPLAT